jgi:hypothetical protein
MNQHLFDLFMERKIAVREDNDKFISLLEHLSSSGIRWVNGNKPTENILVDQGWVTAVFFNFGDPYYLARASETHFKVFYPEYIIVDAAEIMDNSVEIDFSDLNTIIDIP